MTTNPLIELTKQGQSIWFDNISRELIESGELRRMIEEDGVTGVTSNPTIFDRAIAGSTDYDRDMRALLEGGAGVEAIYEHLVVEDVRAAADMLRPTFDTTQGADGYVSLEVSPLLASNTEQTIAQARHLFARVDRPNLMIKVPATAEGIPAIQTLIGEKINVNVTLIFSMETYRQVAEAYITGLERLDKAGGPLDGVASVASFFVSRVDSVVDKRLDRLIELKQEASAKDALRKLKGTAAIANSRMAYRIFQNIFGTSRFRALEKRGARPQRVLWASTGTKSPEYSDVMYIENLIGPQTVNTVPPATLAAFRDHGTVRPALLSGQEDARKTLEELRESGIDLDEVTDKLLDAGVKAFTQSFEQLMGCIGQKRDRFLAGLGEGDGLGSCA